MSNPFQQLFAPFFPAQANKESGKNLLFGGLDFGVVSQKTAGQTDAPETSSLPNFLFGVNRRYYKEDATLVLRKALWESLHEAKTVKWPNNNIAPNPSRGLSTQIVYRSTLPRDIRDGTPPVTFPWATYYDEWSIPHNAVAAPGWQDWVDSVQDDDIYVSWNGVTAPIALNAAEITHAKFRLGDQGIPPMSLLKMKWSEESDLWFAQPPLSGPESLVNIRFQWTGAALVNTEAYRIRGFTVGLGSRVGNSDAY